jgi:hypothetical protein
MKDIATLFICMSIIAINNLTNIKLADAAQVSANKNMSAKIKASKPPAVGFIQKVRDGVGCWFHTPKDFQSNRQRYIYQKSLTEDQPVFLMNIDGFDVNLNLVKTINKKKGFTEYYKNANIRVRADFVLNPNDKNENTGYYLTLRVTRAGKTTTVKSMGRCGC